MKYTKSKMINSNYLKINSQMELPFLETNREMIKNIFNTLENKFGLLKNSDQKLIDLGSGNGHIVMYSALNYGIKSIGIEINENLINEAKERILQLKMKKVYKRSVLKKIKLINGDLFIADLKEFDYIYIYSLPTMQKYLKHVFKTAKNIAIVISYKYALNGLDSILKFISKLNQNINDQLINTFFYQKY